MKTNFFTMLRMLLAPVLFMFASFQSQAQVCDNLSLAFDGNGDYILRNLTGTSFLPNDNFTAEAWFTSTSAFTNCTGNFRRLFSLSGSSPNSRFEVGECNSIIHIYWFNIAGGGPPQPIAGTPFSPGCHHIAVVRNGDAVDIYLDGNLVDSFTGIGVLNTNTFRVGTWQGGPSAGSDWEGEADEIRLWNVARTATQINDFKDCTLSSTSGQIPNLLVNWTLDQNGTGASAGGNNLGAVAIDMSGSTIPNNGTLNGFDLTSGNITSNFICNSCPLRYDMDISDFPAPFPVGLVSICNGDPAHFCIFENGNSVGSIPGATIDWQYSDDNGLNWFNVNTPSFSGYCFYIPPGEIDITTDCTNSTTGNVNRKYRAKITKVMGTPPLTCTYTTTERDLQICCPVTATAVLNPQPPIPAGSTLCEGTVTVDVSLTGPPFLPNLSIQWCIDGVHNSSFDNLTSFTYTGPALAPSICFEAKIQNCSCPMITVKTCIPVDPLPMCGSITGLSTSLTLVSPDHYVICPGDQAQVGMVIPSDFKNCNPVWQFHFDTDPIGFPNWQDLGTSNPVQNTNTLPQLSPPNPPTLLNGLPNPYIWPLGAKCIYYRIECRPLSYPNSGCPPCHTNILEVCLKTAPTYTLSGNPTQFCANGGFSTININPTPPPTSIINWYCNGVLVGPNWSPTYIAGMTGCCWATIFDGCFTVTTPKFCVEACEIVPIIYCPTDNPCACNGLPITLNGCDSYDTCLGTGPLTFTWLADGNSVPGSGPNGCELIHTPNPNGTLYTLTVCNSLNPSCCATTTLWIKPCI